MACVRGMHAQGLELGIHKYQIRPVHRSSLKLVLVDLFFTTRVGCELFLYFQTITYALFYP